ncbi:hypothetical protein WJX79_004322 [Trebouxia sp. C0005]
MRVAPLQQELGAVKVELQQLREKVESSPAIENSSPVTVESKSVADKKKVFKAGGKLAACNVGLDDDLTPLQQKQKAAAWENLKKQGLAT